MRLVVDGKYKDGSPKMFLMPESGKQTHWLRNLAANGTINFKARLIGDEAQGFRLQLKVVKNG